MTSDKTENIQSRARKNAEMAPFNLNNWLPLADTFRTALFSYDTEKLEEVKVILYQQERTVNG